MENLIKDAIEGFVILAILAGIYGLSNERNFRKLWI